MRHKRTVKRLGTLLLTAVTAAGLLCQPLDLYGASAGTAASYTKSGTFHVMQFGEYDVHAAVTVEEGKIADVEITGDNFGGTYADVNKGKLQSAIDGIADRFLGLKDTDKEGIKEVDAVSGATYSSEAIKNAVGNALELDMSEDTPAEVPSQKPQAGTYDITVAVRSDVIDHSLVQTETAQAVLEVTEDGEMRLSYTMVSGTDQEPMYILGFDGYYEDNDPQKELTLEGAACNTEERNGYTVVTDVSFPLSEMSRYYYNSTYIYVPAMSNLNGEINGVLFENGKFHIKTIVTMYWDTLTKQGDASGSTKSMEISASVEEESSAPDYIVSLPASLSMGRLSSTKDNVMGYGIVINDSEAAGKVQVTAPGEGTLTSGRHTLAFANDFGTQSFFRTGGASALTRSMASEETQGDILWGNITITGEDVAAAAPGNYTGTTVFTISYQKESEDPGTEDPDSPGGEDSENPGQEKPGDGAGDDPEDPGTEDPGQDETLKEGRYAVDIALWHAVNSTLSMGNSALDLPAAVVVHEDGSMTLEIAFQSLNISGMEGYLYRLKKVDMSTVEYNQYQYPVSYQASDAEVLETFTGVHDAYNDPDSASYDPNTEGKEYPKVISIPVEQGEDMNYVEIYVPIMESISAGQGTQVARLHIDWDSLKAYETDPDDQDPGSGTQDPDDETPENKDPDTQDPDDQNPDDQEPEDPDSGKGDLDYKNLKDGVYSLTGTMVKVDKKTLSMANDAINHTIKLTVKDSVYWLTMDFKGLQINTQLGYLRDLKYFLTGYSLDQYGNPTGETKDVTIDTYQTEEDGSRIRDTYGTDYPDIITFAMIPEALEDSYVPLQVFVPIMESIAAGTGTQPVFLALDWSTLKETQENDPAFSETEEKKNQTENQDDEKGSDLNGGSGLTGGSGLNGGSSLTGGSGLNGGSGLSSGSGLGSSSLSGNSSLKASNAKTGDEMPVEKLICLAAAALILIGGVLWKSHRKNTEEKRNS